MSSGEARPHNDMLRLAVEVVKLLAPYTTRIAIAGSLRRGKAEVRDIEIVCAPNQQQLPTGGRRGFLQIPQNGANWICDRLRDEKVFEPRLNLNGNPQSWGDQQKWFRYKGVNVDLYAVLPGYSWGRELLIRTGPGDANECLVTRYGQTSHSGIRGVLPAPYKFQSRELYYADSRIETPEESMLFAALDLPYIPPPLRSVEMYQAWAERRRDWVTPGGYVNGRLMSAKDTRFGDDIWLPGDARPRFLNIQVGTKQEKVSA